jgi:hypothetical protein
LDTGQNRVNHYHHPERLRPPDEHTWTPTTWDEAHTHTENPDPSTADGGVTDAERDRHSAEAPPETEVRWEPITSHGPPHPGGPDPPLAA